MAWPCEQVLEAGEAGVAGVAALDRLGELHLVADEDQVPGRESDGDRVGERDLAGLVDEEVVEPALASSCTAEDPGGAADEHAAVAERAGHVLRLELLDDCPAVTSGSSSWSPTL